MMFVAHRRKAFPIAAAFSFLSLLCLFVVFAKDAAAANVIAGSARNLSRDQPAEGDSVILLRLDKGMQEESRTKTDANGAFTLPVKQPDKIYLVRVVHQGVNYDQQASAGDDLRLLVFDAAPQVNGITGSIEILRAGTNGNLLHVSDMYEIRNESNPPLTRSGERTFEVYLPPDARMDSVLAAGPGKISVMIDAIPVPRDPGHYTVNFPLRPGATKFAFNYDLPYSGHAAFQTNHVYTFQQLAVMFPPTMQFSSRSSSFQLLETGNAKYQVQATAQLKSGKGPRFELSGIGALPPLGDQAKSQSVPSSSSQSSSTIVPAVSAPGRSNLPAEPNTTLRLDQAQPTSQKLVLATIIVLILVSCILIVRARRKSPRQVHLESH